MDISENNYRNNDCKVDVLFTVVKDTLAGNAARFCNTSNSLVHLKMVFCVCLSCKIQGKLIPRHHVYGSCFYITKQN